MLQCIELDVLQVSVLIIRCCSALSLRRAAVASSHTEYLD